MKTPKDWYADFVRDNFLNMPEFIKDIQRDAWEAGAKKMADEIINDVWGSWAEAGCKSVPIPPFPEEP